MRKKHLLLLVFVLLISGHHLIAADGLFPTNAMDEAWREFRQIHPYGYQTVALKHVDDECIFIISEPSESVTERALDALFRKYGGKMTVKHQPLGYDGWLADAVGSVKFPNNKVPDDFTQDLFNLLYGTDYKHYYTDLDNPSEHVYFSEYRLNYSISAAEIHKWFISDKEAFKVDESKTKTISALLSSNSSQTNEIFYSKEHGFIVWVVSPDKITASDKTFKTNARQFALDSDLIIGAIGKKDGKVAIIARERVVPVTVLPPLRIETITLLATTDNDELAQSFERYNVFAGKTEDNLDMAPIYLSDELQNTEYGNLLNMTDQMLKSWTENNDVHDYNYDYPAPIDWAFNEGVFRDLNMGRSLTYNWNTAGAGYVIKNWDGLDIYAVNRTGSLPVSFIPEGMEGKVNPKVNEAEELAFDFFSELNSPELVREVQYATLYQIFRYFSVPPKKELKTIEQWRQYLVFELNNINISHLDLQNRIRETDSIIKSKMSLYQDSLPKYMREPSYPNFSISNPAPKSSFDPLFDCVEDLLRFSMYLDTPEHHESCVLEGYNRYLERYAQNSVQKFKTNLIDNDPYGGFESYLREKKLYTDDFDESDEPSKYLIRLEYKTYLSSSIDTISNYIENYQSLYGSFPYQEASKYIVDRNAWEREIKKILESIELNEQECSAVIDEFNKKVDEYNNKKNRTFKDQSDLDFERTQVKKILNHLNKEAINDQKEFERLISLKLNTSQERALGTLNWLLTDPAPYDAPIGPFYSDRCTSHKQWMKSSPVTCSTISWGYGGHNLNASISPINIASKAPKSGKVIKEGCCFVSLEKGQKVFTVANVDKAKITPQVLRTIERETVVTEKGKLFKLPQAPKERPKIAVIEKGSANEARGFDIQKHLGGGATTKSVLVDGREVKTSAELHEALADGFEATGSNAGRTIQFKDYSARKVHVHSKELGDCVIDRSPGESINLSDFSDDIKVVSQSDGTVKITLEQLPSTLPDKGLWKNGTLEITCPGQDVNSTETAIKKVRALPKQQIDNSFKWKQKLNMELQKTDPGFNFIDIKCEYNLIGYMFYEFDNEILFENAA